MPTRKPKKKREKILLPGGCHRSAMTVYPSNWDKSPASMKVNWYVNYRFYDASGASKQIPLKGMNAYRDWHERKDATRTIIEDEAADLLSGYNPITDTYTPVEAVTEVSPETPLIAALQFASNAATKGKSIKKDLRSVLRYVEPATVALRLKNLPVGHVTKKHIKLILSKVGASKAQWSGNAYNYYRSRLSILFQELMEYEAVEFDPAVLLKKQKHLRKLPKTLTEQEREKVKEHLEKIHPDFGRTMEIFFHSGIRETEMLRLRTEDVELANERFKVTVLKCGQPVEEWREIKDIALPLWITQMEKAKAGDYVFSIGFIPGAGKAHDSIFTRNWRRLVKDGKHGIGIKSNFYHLKHAHTTETIDMLEGLALNPVKLAAQHNGHKSTEMVEKHYDTKNGTRKGKLVKMLDNPFVKKAE